MKKTSIVIFVGLFSLMADAADKLLEHGAKLAASCEACHGATSPTTDAPNPFIGGQHGQYLVDALIEYQRGARDDKSMQTIAKAMSANDMAAVSAYYAQIKMPATISNPARAFGVPEQRPLAAAACVNCHGINGISQSEDFPLLAGQKESYLRQVLQDYTTGKRRHRVMTGQAAALTEKQIDEVAKYFSAMPGLCLVMQSNKRAKNKRLTCDRQ